MKVPGIYVVIKGDHSQLSADLNRAEKMVRDSSKSMADAMQNALTPGQINKSYDLLINSLSKLTTAAKSAQQGLKPLGVELGDLQHRVGVTAEKWSELQGRLLDTRRMQQAESALNSLKRSLNLNDVETLDYAKAFGLSGTSATAYGAAVKAGTSGAMTNLAILAESANLSQERLSSLQAMATKGVDVKVRTQALRGLVDQLGLSRNEVKALEKEFGVSLSSMERGVKGFAAAFANIGMYGGIYTAVAMVQQLGAAAVKAAMDMDKLRLTLEGVYGDRAGAEGKYIEDFADKYGKGIVETSNAYVKFAAAAEYVGVSTEATRKIFEATTKAITKVGGSTGDVSGALVALGQMLSKGTVSAEEFRLQFGERIPGAMKMGADAMGVSVAQFKEMMKSGELVSTDFLPKLADQLDKFGQGWEKAAGSLESNIQRMKNQFALLAESLLSLDEAKAGVAGIASGLSGARGLTEDYAAMEKLNEAISAGKISLDQFVESGSMAYTALRAMSELPGFGLLVTTMATLTADADKARETLERLADANKQKVADLETQYRALFEMLRNSSRDGIDMSSSQAELDGIRQALAQVQGELNRLTGTNYVVKIDFQANMGVVYEAQAAVQKLYADSEQAKRAAVESALMAAERDKAKAQSELVNIGSRPSRPGDRDDAGRNEDYRKTRVYLEQLDYATTKYRQDLQKMSEESIKSSGAMATLKKSYDGVAVSSLSTAQQVAYAEKEKSAAIADADRMLAQGMITQEQYALRVDSARGSYDKFIESLNKTPRGGQSAMDSLAHKLERTQDIIADLKAQIAGSDFDAALENIDRKYDMMLGDAQRGLRKVGGEAQALFDAIEEARGLEKQKLEMEALRERTAQVSQLMRELGELTGDRGMVREGMLAEIKQQADAAKLALKGVFSDGPALEDAYKLVDAKAEQDGLRVRQQTADSWVEYYDLSVNKLKGIEQAHSKEQLSIWENALSEYTANSEAMYAVRAQSYDQIAAAARASGDAELAVIAEVGKESLALARLQATQKYGSSGDAFTATLAEQWGSYKSEATRARETMVAMGNAIGDLGEEIASGFGSSMSDMVYAAMTGTGSVQDIFDSFLDSLLQAVSNFAGKLAETWMNDIIGQLGSSLLGSLGGGLFSSGGAAASSGGSFGSMMSNVSMPTFNAHGGVYSAPGLSAYRNSVVSSPTVFPFASGGVPASRLGLMGEAGPEAIMPLAKLPSGDLGVKAVGGDGAAAPPPMQVNIYEAQGTSARVEQSADGGSIDVMIEALTNRIVSEGSRGRGLMATLDARYGRRA